MRRNAVRSSIAARHDITILSVPVMRSAMVNGSMVSRCASSKRSTSDVSRASRATKQFERLYDGRTAVERVNGRLKIFWGIDDGQVYGARRFHGHVGAVMVVHLAFATLLAQTERREGTYGTMKLSPIAKALRELMQTPATPVAEPAHTR